MSNGGILTSSTHATALALYEAMCVGRKVRGAANTPARDGAPTCQNVQDNLCARRTTCALPHVLS